jgi:signal transduction histidine kinase
VHKSWSTSTRAAVAAGAISAVLFTACALLIRLTIGDLHGSRVRAQTEGAYALADALKAAVLAGDPIPEDLSSYYEIVHSDGRILSSGVTMRDAEQVYGGPIVAPPTAGVPAERRVIDFEGVEVVTWWDPSASPRPQQIVAETVQVAGAQVGIYVFIVPRENDTIPAVDRILWPAVPGAVLLVALVAWFATRRALRPVDWIRAQAAEMSANALDQRIRLPAKVVDRRSWSIGARAALAASLIAVGPLVGGALWLRHELDDVNIVRQMAELQATDYASDALRTAVQNGNPISSGTRDAQAFLYEVVRQDGRILDSSSGLRAAEIGAGGPLMPPPSAARPDPKRNGIIHPDPVDESRMTALVPALVSPVSVLPRTVNVNGEEIGIYVYNVPARKENPAYALDRILYPGVPASIGLVGLVAWGATTRALRPVERIRGQAAEFSTRALDMRVPVPPTRDALARLAMTLNETLDRLEKSVQAQRQFIADAAHELRSPIASLRTVLEVAADHPGQADWPSVVRDAVLDTQRLQSLAEDLLLLARLDSAQPRTSTPVDLSTVAADHVAGKPRVSLHTNGPAIINGDPKQLDRLLRNLVDNAERHARTEITVTVESTEDKVRLIVADDGPGIPPEDRERVFDRFTRLDEARDSDAGGTGLGLAIAREIAVLHGATLTVTDQRPGAVFIAEFPRA